MPHATIGGRPLDSVELDQATLGKCDAAIILVDHSYYDLETILLHAKLVIDAQDAMRSLEPRGTIVKL